MRNLAIALLLALAPIRTMAAPPAATAVAFSPDGGLIASAALGEVRLVDASTFQSRGAIRVSGRVTAIAFSGDRRWMAVASGETGKDGIVSLFPLSDSAGGSARAASAPAATITAHKDAIYALAFTPDGKQLATAGYDRVIHLWDVAADGQAGKEPRLTLKDHSDTVYGLDFHPDGRWLASAGADRAVKVWDIATGKRLYTLGDATDWVYCVAWSPDKKHLAAAGVDRSVRVWLADAEGGTLVCSAFAHEKPVWRLAYADRGATLYTAGEDRVLKSFDALKLTEKKVFEVQPDAILGLAIAPAGDRIALARFDGVALVLDAKTGKSVAQLLPRKPVPPQPARLVPAGVPLGKRTTITVSGTDLEFTTGVTSTRTDVKVEIAAKSAESLSLAITVPAQGNAGATELTFIGEAGKSSPIKLALDRFAAVVESGVTDSARAAQVVKIPATLAGVLDRAGDADFYRFEAKAGDQIGVQLVAAELGSKIDPVLVLSDANGSVVAEGTTTLGFTVMRPGAYSIGIRDREFRGGPDFTYRLHVGDVPVVTSVFPLAIQRGRTMEVHIDGVNLGSAGGSRVRVGVPADAQPGTRVAVPVPNLALGKPEITVAEFPSVVVDPVAGADVRIPGSADGILTKPNEAQHARFEARKGQRLAIEVLARRAGSPADPVIEVLDASGKPVPRALLRATAKTYSTFRDHDSAGPGIRLEAWNELAIDDYLYVGGELMRIVALPRNPDDDCQFYQVAGRRTGFLGTTPLHHAQGNPMYKVEIHPPGAAFPPNGLPVFPIHYRNDDGGADFGKDSFLLFDVPADGAYQVRVGDARGASSPAHAYRITVRPPRPRFDLAMNPSTPRIWKGGAIPVTVTVTRHDGFDGPVRIQLDGLPEGLHAPPTFIEVGHTTTTFALFADAAAAPKAPFKLVARATIDGKEMIREVTSGLPSTVEPGDLVTRTGVHELAIRPGKETRFQVEIERRGKFAGRVPVEVRGLPHGVRVLNIGLNGILITERETRREVLLYAEPWVQAMEHPIVVLARSEGKNTEHAAKSILLKVEK
jgi:WD40 repeat protein